MTVRKFCMVMRNHFFTISLCAATTTSLFHFAWLCENFAWSCEIENHAIPAPLCNFSHFFMFNPSPPPSIKLQNLVQVHLDHHQLYLFSSIWLISFVTNLSKLYLEMTPNFIKLVSNSYKGNNMLIECFRHNYYSKYMKLMRIIIENMLFLSSNHQIRTKFKKVMAELTLVLLTIWWTDKRFLSNGNVYKSCNKGERLQ